MTKPEDTGNSTRILIYPREALAKLIHQPAAMTAGGRKYKDLQHTRSAMRFGLICYNARAVS